MKKTALGILSGIMVLALAWYAVGQTGAKTDTSEASKKELVWHKYDEALEIAKQDNRHVFVFFTTAWCGYCKKMEKSTFPDPGVFKLMTEAFTLAKVDGDSRNIVKVADKNGEMIEMSERQLTRALGIRGYPSMMYLKPDGTSLSPPMSGYLSAEQLDLILRYVSTKAYETMTLKDFAAKEQG